MRNFILGFAAGMATYHYVLSGENKELVTEVRTMIRNLDEKLAEAEKGKAPPENIPGAPTEPTVTAQPPRTPPQTPPPSPPKAA
jgi:hypothetical protein